MKTRRLPGKKVIALYKEVERYEDLHEAAKEFVAAKTMEEAEPAEQRLLDALAALAKRKNESVDALAYFARRDMAAMVATKLGIVLDETKLVLDDLKGADKAQIGGMEDMIVHYNSRQGPEHDPALASRAIRALDQAVRGLGEAVVLLHKMGSPL